MLERSWLQSDVLQGLIVLSGGAEGDIGQAIAAAATMRLHGA